MDIKPSLIDVFNLNIKKFNDTIALNIVNSICTTNFGVSNESFDLEIISFVNFLKNFDMDLYRANQDLIIFRLYDQIIEENLSQIQNKIHSLLSSEQIKIINEFSNKIYSKSEVYNCSFNIYNKIYYTTTENKQEFLSLLEYSLYCNNALILFIHNNEEPVVFGFTIKDNKFMELEITNEISSELQKEFPLVVKNLTTFSEINIENS